MPQLDMSTWLITIISMLLALFIFSKLKSLITHSPSNPQPKDMALTHHKTPWESKWTKIYSPLSLPLHL
nr:ATP synthase F0 subunit 8 [Callosciurus orestes]